MTLFYRSVLMSILLNFHLFVYSILYARRIDDGIGYPFPFVIVL